MMSNQPMFAGAVPSTPLGKVFGHHAPSRENFVLAIGFNSTFLEMIFGLNGT